MTQSLLERLQLVSDKIEDEKSAVFAEAIACFAGITGEAGKPETVRKQTEREKTAFLVLRSLRLQIYLDLIGCGQTSYTERIREDWDEVVGCVKYLEYEWKISNELLSDTVDLVLLFGPDRRNELLKRFDFSTRMKIKKQKPLRPETYFSAVHMIEYCWEQGMAEEACTLTENLISLSEERNSSDLDRHRELIRRTLWYIVDIDHPLAIRICEKQRKYFEGVRDYNASRFFWFYAASLNEAGRSKDALPLLKYCHELCLQVEGETSWIGARAGQLYNYYLLLSDDFGDAEAYLWDALQKIDERYYSDMDGSADFVGAFTRYVLLKKHMDAQTLRELLPEIERLREYCESTKDAPMSPVLTVRSAENILSAYYLEAGNYLQAAQHAMNAILSIPPNELTRLPSDDLLYTNLLQIYSQLNDADQMVELVQILAEKLEQYEDNDSYYYRMCLLIQTAEKRLGIPLDDRIEEYRQTLLELRQRLDTDVEQLPEGKSGGDELAFAMWTLEIVSTVLDTFTSNQEELTCFRDIILHFLHRPKVYRFNHVQKMAAYMLLADAEWQMGSPKALDSLEQCLQYSKMLTASHEARISAMRFAAVVYHNVKRPDLGLPVISETLTGIMTAWQKATAYLNDHKVCQLLSFVQSYFCTCYAILRKSINAEELYERVLQFKNLPALVGRERSRVFRLAPVDEHLREQIFRLQDQLASAQFQDSMQGTNTAKDISVRLQQLEAEFADQFPQNVQFTEISFDRVCKKLPDDSAVIEYYFAPGEETLSGRPLEKDVWELDIFIISKVNGKTKLNYLKMPDGDLIREQTMEFVGILQDSERVTRNGEKTTLRGALYRGLIKPVVPYLDGVKTLYIAPDDVLCNLPFEILYADGSGLLQEQFQVCRLVCGRDLLFYDNQANPNGTCFVLGDPDYDAEKGDRSQPFFRNGAMELDMVPPLPFSGIEAARISRRCRTHACIGKAATKYALQEALPCRIIHLATHGAFDMEMETDSLYSSYLIFAGYNKWAIEKTESRYCGNGILTADEISRMDLRQAELVVLSACQSGLGDPSYGSAQGLLSAFSAAGARWVVSHMWKANDFTTPILMDAFYDAYLNQGKDVPDALQHARNYLRTVTVGELRRSGWLDVPRDVRIPQKLRDDIDAIRAAVDQRKPFSDELFWGGFVAHKCR